MPWFKVDDKLHDHHKSNKAGARAMGLWVMAGSWSADNLKDGFVPERVALRWGTRSDANRLVECGLWEIAQKDGEKGWQFYQWDQFQPTRADVEHKREQARERMANMRAGSQDVRANKTRTSQNVREPRPDPSRPVPTDTSNDVSNRDAGGDPFDDFWDSYPRKAGKGQARKAWTGALKKVDSTTLIKAAADYARWCANGGVSSPDFIAHPSTWLNGERWLDERPARAAPTNGSRLDGHVALINQIAAQEKNNLPQLGAS